MIWKNTRGYVLIAAISKHAGFQNPKEAYGIAKNIYRIPLIIL